MKGGPGGAELCLERVGRGAHVPTPQVESHLSGGLYR